MVSSAGFSVFPKKNLLTDSNLFSSSSPNKFFLFLSNGNSKKDSNIIKSSFLLFALNLLTHKFLRFAGVGEFKLFEYCPFFSSSYFALIAFL
ncbi:hypothetical protein D3C72_1215290 [compost metagenome]